MAKIKTGFSTFSDAGLSIEAGKIIASMTGNTNFTNPLPPLAAVKDALDAFDTAMSNMGNGSKDVTMVKNKTRVTVEALLTELGLYVQLQSKGDEIILQSSGYELASRRTSVGVLPKPINFVAAPSDARGSIKVSMKAIDGAKSYIYEYTKAPSTATSDWDSITIPRASAVISDLTSGQQYTFRAVGIGTNPTKIYSDEISSFVL
jgi:hypothetical protein